MEFEIGQKLTHKYTGETLWVLKKGNEQILCRTSDLREIWFYPQELNLSTDVYEGKSPRFL